MTDATAEIALTPAQAEAVRDAGVFTLGTTRWFTSQLIENLTPEQWVHQASTGVNHILWNVGHVATSDAVFLKAAGGTSSAVPQDYEALFGMDSTPKPALDAYPDPKEIVGAFTRVREDLIAYLKGLTGAQLAGPVEGDMLKQVAPTIAQMANFVVLHECMHSGQILIARKTLGLPRVLG